MTQSFYCFLFFSLILYPAFSSQNLFVIPKEDCNDGCTGDLGSPFNNVLNALKQAALLESATIILMNNPLLSHYLYEENETGSVSSGLLELGLDELIIKPLYCNEEPALSNSSLAGNCIPEDQKVTVYVKTTNFSIIVKTSLEIRGVIFDAVEDIAHWNSDLTNQNVSACLHTQTRCCEEGETTSSLFADVYCDWQDNSVTFPINSNYSLFTLNDQGDQISIMFEDTEFNNFLSPHLKSLIDTKAQPFSLSLNNVQINRAYFDKGIISYTNTADEVTNPNNSYINIKDSSLSNYNLWNMALEDKTKQEGYLFYSENTFSGVIEITGSTFTNITSSLRNSCWPQTTDYYVLPMNNLLSSEPRSRSDLWSQYHYEIHTNNDYISSLIFIRKMNGSLNVSDCVFRNVMGTSGVIRIDDTISSDENQFIIYNSIFDGNFAYDRFANIMITKASNPYFSSMLDCPYVEIVNSTFQNSYGCPGAYGNVLSLCYWDSQPRATLANYSLGGQDDELKTAWTSQSNNFSYMSIRNSTFQSNLLAVSNSLAIIGAPYVELEDNIFQDNGGTTAEIAGISLQESYYFQRYQPDDSVSSPFTHFGQSTCTYFDHLVVLHSTNNIYTRNWGSWEGSLALGSAITVKNWLTVESGLIFEDDIFDEHVGIPMSLTSQMSDGGLASNVFTEPIITVSLDITGSDIVSNALGNTDSINNIILQGVTFSNNIANYAYDQYTYNSNELQSLITETIPSDLHYEGNLLKLLWVSESLDSLATGFTSEDGTLTRTGFVFTGGVINNNQLLSEGCLFASVMALDTCEISANEIYLAGEYVTQSLELSESYTFYSETFNYGLLCIGTINFNGPSSKLQLIANNNLFKDNQGILMNIIPSTNGQLYLLNSIFSNNTCERLSIIIAQTTSQLSYINNIFIENHNVLGVVFSYYNLNSFSIYNSYLRNTGVYASIIYTETTVYSEVGATAYWNDLDPTYKLFQDGITPQGAIYYNSYSQMEIINSNLAENLCYSGLLVAYGGITTFYGCQIENHQVVGTSLVGTFLSVATVYIQNTVLQNNTIIKDTSMPKTHSSFLVLLTAILYIDDVTLVGGSAQNGGMLMFMNIVTASVSGLAIQDFYSEDYDLTALIYVGFSTVDMEFLQCSNITGLFKFVGSTISMTSTQIDNITSIFGSQFIIETSDTILDIKDLQYIGNGEYTDLLSLIEGDKTSLTMTNAYFKDASGGENTVFSLKRSKLFLVTNSVFEYTYELANVTIFDVSSSNTIILQGNTFSFVGTVLTGQSLQEEFIFTKNTILTDSHLENIILQNANSCSIFENQLITPQKDSNQSLVSLPEAQIEILDSLSNMEISHNQFISLLGTTGIVSITCKKYPYTVTVFDNLFISNLASSGGSIYLSSNQQWTNSQIPEVDISNSIFIANKAMNWQSNPGKGGAIYQTSPSKAQQQTSVSSCIFINNIAEQIGGAIYFDYSPLLLTHDSWFEGNYAARPNNIGAYPARLIYLTDDSELNKIYIPGAGLRDLQQDDATFFRWNDVGSGVINHQNYTFALLDMYGQLVYDDSSSVLEILPQGLTDQEKAEFTTLNSITAQNGLCLLNDFEFNYRTNETINVTFISSAISSLALNPISNISVSPSITVEIKFRMCTVGEFMILNGGFASCQECPYGFWQVNPTTTMLSCSACDETSTICRGGNNVGPRAGYWRMNETADLVIACPRSESCIGNPLDGTTDADLTTLDPVGSCGYSYTGNLCNNCIDGWAKGNNDECIECSTSTISYFYLVLMLFFQAGLIAMGIKNTLDFGKKFTDPLEANSAALLRIFINYTQIFSLIVGIPISWPEILQKILGLTSKFNVSGEQVFSIDCFFELGREAFGVERVYLKALFTATIPSLFIVLGAIFWLVYYRLKRLPIFGNKNLGNSIIATVVIICFDLQPSVIKEAFALFHCTNLYRSDEPINFLVDSYDIRCWEGEHLMWSLSLALPCLVLWIIVLPGLLFYTLSKNKRQLDQPQIAKKYSFIYTGYKQERYYWEIIIMLRKITLISNSVFTSAHSTNMEVYISFIFILIASLIHEAFPAFAEEKLNALERVSLLSLSIVNLCGLYFQFVSNASGFDTVIIAVGLLGNLYFLVCFGHLYAKIFWKKLRANPYFNRAITLIDKYFCCYLRVPRIRKLINKIQDRFKTQRSLTFVAFNVPASSSNSMIKEFSSRSDLKLSSRADFKAKSSLYGASDDELMFSPKNDRTQDDEIIPSERPLKIEVIQNTEAQRPAVFEIEKRKSNLDKAEPLYLIHEKVKKKIRSQIELYQYGE